MAVAVSTCRYVEALIPEARVAGYFRGRDNVVRWHDPANGRFAPDGWSVGKAWGLIERAVKFAARDHIEKNHHDDGGGWVVPSAGYLTKFGVPDGHAVKVRWVSNSHGMVRVRRHGRYVPFLVEWDKFSDELPTDRTPHVDELVFDHDLKYPEIENASMIDRLLANGGSGWIQTYHPALEKYGVTPETVLPAIVTDDHRSVIVTVTDGRRVKLNVEQTLSDVRAPDDVASSWFGHDRIPEPPAPPTVSGPGPAVPDRPEPLSAVTPPPPVPSDMERRPRREGGQWVYVNGRRVGYITDEPAGIGGSRRQLVFHRTDRRTPSTHVLHNGGTDDEIQGILNYQPRLDTPPPVPTRPGPVYPRPSGDGPHWLDPWVIPHDGPGQPLPVKMPVAARAGDDPPDPKILDFQQKFGHFYGENGLLNKRGRIENARRQKALLNLPDDTTPDVTPAVDTNDIEVTPAPRPMPHAIPHVDPANLPEPGTTASGGELDQFPVGTRTVANILPTRETRLVRLADGWHTISDKGGVSDKPIIPPNIDQIVYTATDANWDTPGVERPVDTSHLTDTAREVEAVGRRLNVTLADRQAVDRVATAMRYHAIHLDKNPDAPAFPPDMSAPAVRQILADRDTVNRLVRDALSDPTFDFNDRVTLERASDWLDKHTPALRDRTPPDVIEPPHPTPLPDLPPTPDTPTSPIPHPSDDTLPIPPKSFDDIAPDGQVYRHQTSGRIYSPKGPQGAIYFTGDANYGANYGDEQRIAAVPDPARTLDIRDAADRERIRRALSTIIDQLDPPDDPADRRTASAVVDARAALEAPDSPAAIGRALANTSLAINARENPADMLRPGIAQKRVMDQLDMDAMVDIESDGSFSFAYSRMPSDPVGLVDSAFTDRDLSPEIRTVDGEIAGTVDQTDGGWVAHDPDGNRVDGTFDTHDAAVAALRDAATPPADLNQPDPTVVPRVATEPPPGFTADAGAAMAGARDVQTDADAAALADGGAELWHTTTAATAVRRDGLKAGRDVDTTGLGNRSDDARTTISATYSRAYAETVERSLRLAHRVAIDDIGPADALTELLDIAGTSGDVDAYTLADEFGIDRDLLDNEWDFAGLTQALQDEANFTPWDMLTETAGLLFDLNLDSSNDSYDPFNEIELDDNGDPVDAFPTTRGWHVAPIQGDQERYAALDPNEIAIVQLAARPGTAQTVDQASAEARFDPYDVVVLDGSAADGTTEIPDAILANPVPQAFLDLVTAADTDTEARRILDSPISGDRHDFLTVARALTGVRGPQSGRESKRVVFEDKNRVRDVAKAVRRHAKETLADHDTVTVYPPDTRVDGSPVQAWAMTPDGTHTGPPVEVPTAAVTGWGTLGGPNVVLVQTSKLTERGPRIDPKVEREQRIADIMEEAQAPREIVEQALDIEADIRAEIRNLARNAEYEAWRPLEQLGIVRMARPEPLQWDPMVGPRTSRAAWSRPKAAGEWDWFDLLSPGEQQRLRDRWMPKRPPRGSKQSVLDQFDAIQKTGQPEHVIDAVLDTLQDPSMSRADALEWWLHQTGVVDALQDVAKNRTPRSGVDMDKLGLEPSSVRVRPSDVIGRDRWDAATRIAQALVGEQDDEAVQVANQALSGSMSMPEGDRPWDVGFTAWAADVAELADWIGELEAEGATVPDAAREALDQLLPTGFGPNDTLEGVYTEITSYAATLGYDIHPDAPTIAEPAAPTSVRQAIADAKTTLPPQGERFAGDSHNFADLAAAADAMPGDSQRERDAAVLATVTLTDQERAHLDSVRSVGNAIRDDVETRLAIHETRVAADEARASYLDAEAARDAQDARVAAWVDQQMSSFGGVFVGIDDTWDQPRRYDTPNGPVFVRIQGGAITYRDQHNNSSSGMIPADVLGGPVLDDAVNEAWQARRAAEAAEARTRRELTVAALLDGDQPGKIRVTNPDAVPPAVQADLDEIAAMFPSSLLDRLPPIEIAPAPGPGRAGFTAVTPGVVPVTQLKLIPPNPNGPSLGPALTLHEFGHLLETMIDDLSRADWAFLIDRLDFGKDPIRIGDLNGVPEHVRDGGFVEPYAGKQYHRFFARDGKAFEAFTIGLERAFYPKPGAGRQVDPDHEAFVLGAVAMLTRRLSDLNDGQIVTVGGITIRKTSKGYIDMSTGELLTQQQLDQAGLAGGAA